ncbi:MAG: arsenate reductase ArsC [Gammaproteobacteria bacterium]|nr:arsenate reductase ArsC [Gammaproteobacteria bacterium]
MTTHILFLCTHNSARSVLAECLANHWARTLGWDVQAHSAGSAPAGRVNPHALAVLEAAGIDTTGVRSKSWDEFARPGAPVMRIVITVCDSAAAETCPTWPGAPVRAHWGLADPSSAAEADRRHAFEMTRQAIGYRVLQLLALPHETMDDLALAAALQRIGSS